MDIEDLIEVLQDIKRNYGNVMITTLSDSLEVYKEGEDIGVINMQDEAFEEN